MSKNEKISDALHTEGGAFLLQWAAFAIEMIPGNSKMGNPGLDIAAREDAKNPFRVAEVLAALMARGFQYLFRKVIPTLVNEAMASKKSLFVVSYAAVVLVSTSGCSCGNDVRSSKENRIITGEPIVVNGVRFESFADSVWRMPVHGSETNIHLSLRITNQTDVPLRFFLLDTVKLELIDSDGRSLQFDGGRNATKKFSSISESVLPDKTFVLQRLAKLLWTNDDEKGLRLIGSDGCGGIWYFDGLQRGKYRVAFIYTNDKSQIGTSGQIWKGEVISSSVEIVLR